MRDNAQRYKPLHSLARLNFPSLNPKRLGSNYSLASPEGLKRVSAREPQIRIWSREGASSLPEHHWACSFDVTHYLLARVRQGIHHPPWQALRKP